MRMTLLSQKRTKLTADSTLRERLQSAIVRAQALARAGLEKGPEIATRSPRLPCVRACRRNSALRQHIRHCFSLRLLSFWVHGTSFGGANPLGFDLRRDIGIWAGSMALLHTAVGLNVHLRGRMWLYFVDEHGHIRHDWFGFGNDTGVVAAVLFLLLLAISNDLSLRRLGTRRWKSLQRWTYAAVILTILHGVAYQHVEERRAPYTVLLAGITIAIAIFQFAGWRRTTGRCLA